MSGTSRCDCGAPIVWITMRSGTAMACDSPIVEVMLRESGKRRKGDAVVVTDDGFLQSGPLAAGIMFPAGETGTIARGRVSHFATCPNAEKHRKAKRP